MELIVPSRETRYIPEWQGNRDLPDNEQIVVTIRLPDQTEREACNLTKTLSGASDGEFKVDFKIDHKRLVKNCVTEIKGLTVVEADRQKKITKGADLVAQYDQRFSSLLHELGLVIWSQTGLTENEQKN